MNISNKIKICLKYAIAVLLSALFLFPVIYMLACSVMSSQEISKMLDFQQGSYADLKLIPGLFTLEQFYKVFFRRPDYLIQFWNSVIITLPVVLGQVAVSSLSAFAFAKLKFPGRDKLFFVYIILLILPLQVTLVPNYILLENLKLLNTFAGVILPGAFSAFGVCLLRQSMRYISNDSIQAARVEGASYFTVFFKIILPQIKSGLITLVLLTFVDNWNMVEQPLIYFSDKSKYPLSVTLSSISDTDKGIVFACGVMFMIPALIIYFLGEEEFNSPFYITQ